MYQNIANQNSLLNQFNNYTHQNPTFVPFRGNNLIANNVHVANNLNQLVQNQRAKKTNLNNSSKTITPNKSNQKTVNIVEEMLRPQKIMKTDNTDVDYSYCTRKKIQEDAKKEIGIEMTNAPYKAIIKDKIITKKVNDVNEKDLIVHHTIKAIDANIEIFNKELNIKQDEKSKFNEELKIEFDINNYDRHKKKFEFKESFIKNLAYTEKNFSENKEDYIEFYKKKQKEAEEGKKLCDQILHTIENIDVGVISKDELPTKN